MHTRSRVPKHCGLSAVCALITGLASTELPAATAPISSDAWPQLDIALESVTGMDRAGVPMVCGTDGGQAAGLMEANVSGVLSAGMRSWELVPSVIRNDGIDSLRLEVDVNGPVTRVRWDGGFTDYLVAESGTNSLTLRDDGLQGDRVANDNIFTSERLRYRTEIPLPPYQADSTNTPPGLFLAWAGQIRITETNGTETLFLTPPMLSVLNTNVPDAQVVMLASNVQASAHLLNLVTTNRDAQKVLRVGNTPRNLSKQVYDVMPDAFDFLSFITTDHVEYTPQTTSDNFVSGRHFRVRVNYTGTGLNALDQGSLYGSSNRLLGLNVLDTAGRGTGSSDNAAHELMHQWASYTTTGLGLSTGDGHYRPACSVNSLLGGFKLISYYTNGTATRDCVSPMYEAPPLDKYMMGLIDASAVPPIYLGTNKNVPCYPSLFVITGQVTIAQIVAAHGPRTPDHYGAKRNFAIGFVAESHERLLNATEMTYYEKMAEWFTRILPPSAPNPGMHEGWVPITRFFGEGTTWTSDMLTLILPQITGIERLTNGTVRVLATGYPGRNYRLLGSTNLINWVQVTNATAAETGALLLPDNSQPRPFRDDRAASP